MHRSTGTESSSENLEGRGRRSRQSGKGRRNKKEKGKVSKDEENKSKQKKKKKPLSKKKAIHKELLKTLELWDDLRESRNEKGHQIGRQRSEPKGR